MLLVGTATAMCVFGVSAFLLADSYRLSPVWVFFGLNSVGFVAVVWRSFRSYSKTLPFICFLAAWLMIHSAIMVALTAWFSILVWLPVILLELFVGYLIAHQLFRNPGTDGTFS